MKPPLQRHALILAALFLLGGCGTARPPKRVSNVLDNKVTTDRVELAFQNEHGFDFSHVQVQTDGTTVTLTGTVNSAAARARAEALASSLERVQKVENQIVVSGGRNTEQAR